MFLFFFYLLVSEDADKLWLHTLSKAGDMESLENMVNDSNSKDSGEDLLKVERLDKRNRCKTNMYIKRKKSKHIFVKERKYKYFTYFFVSYMVIGQ